MVSVLFIIAQKDFRDEELSIPKSILEKGGFGCEVASVTINEVIGMMGAKITPDLSVKDANVDDYDAIIVVGGEGSPTLAQYPEVLRFLKEARNRNKIIASICLGPMVLAMAGILAGKKATVWSSPSYTKSVEVLTEGGAIHKGGNIVEDGNIITAFGPEVANDFGTAVLNKLKEKDREKWVK